MKSITKSVLRAIFLLSVSLSYLSSTSAFGQNLPTFTGDGTQSGLISSVLMDGSPAIAGSTNPNRPYLYLIYKDWNNADFLTIAVSTDGVNFTQYSLRSGPGNFQTNADGAAITTDDFGDAYFAFIDLNFNLEVWHFNPTNGSVNQQSSYFPSDPSNPQDLYPYPDGTYKPAILCVPGTGSISAAGCDMYLAWTGKAWDIYGEADNGPFVNTAYSSNTGITFSPYSTVTESDSQPSNGPSLTYFNNLVNVAYVDQSQGSYSYNITAGNPHVFTASLGSQSWTEFEQPGGYYKNGPAIINWQNTLYAGFNSAYQEDNLWMTANNLSQPWITPQSMGASMYYTSSPSFAVVNTSSATTLYYAELTNYTDLTQTNPENPPNLWLFSDTVSTSPGGHSGGGGGGGCSATPATATAPITTSTQATPMVRPIC